MYGLIPAVGHRLKACAVGFLLLIAAACGSTTSAATPTASADHAQTAAAASGTPAGQATPALNGGTATPTAISGAGPVDLSDANNGASVAEPSGATFHLVLHSTYWSFDGSSNPSVVGVVGSPSASPSPGGIPGMGAGTVTVTLQAGSHGSSILRASRTSCGEALRCTGTSGSFSVTIVVA